MAVGSKVDKAFGQIGIGCQRRLDFLLRDGTVEFFVERAISDLAGSSSVANSERASIPRSMT